MISEFVNAAELKAEKAEKLEMFSGVKLLHIRNQVESILSCIGKNGLFEQYTKHDMSHVDAMLHMLNWIIPQKTQDAMTSTEWMLLVLAIYFHDIGMLVTKKEYENRYNTEYASYVAENRGDIYIKNSSMKEEEKEKFLYQEYVRQNHATRICRWIQGDIDIQEEGGGDEIKKILRNLDQLFKEDLGIICESHHMNNLEDYDIYNIRKRYGSSDEEVANLQYIAVILRTVDLLHITRDRAPAIEYRLICPTNPTSIIEWQKQMAVRAVLPKEKRDDEGNVTDKQEKDTIEITAYFAEANQAEAFFSLMDYLRYARSELKTSYELIQKSMKKHRTVNYQFPWIAIDDEGIKTKDFERNLLKFELNQGSILQMLVGHTLYNDGSVVLRELIQNGLDAVKLQNEIERKNNEAGTSGRINIIWDSVNRTLEFIDNGTGMTLYDIENYLLKIGTSKYASKEFLKEFPEFVSISRFGIGILTCFMVANDVEILTNAKECEKANFITLRNVDGRYLLKKLKKSEIPENIREHGTSIKLHVREEINMENIQEDIKRWIVFPYCSVFFKKDNEEEIKIGYESPREAIEHYIKQGGILSQEEIRVEEEEINGITIAYAVKYSEYLQEYTLIEYDRIEHNFEDFCMSFPIGVCFEGIRVSDYTPGYRSRGIVAIMNSKNSKIAQTNVARSSIEENSGKEELLKIIYTIYKNYVLNQIEFLKKKNYSLSWISSEVKYLLYPIFHLNKGIEIHENDLIENVKVMKDVFGELAAILFEENGKRKLVSAKYLQQKEEINFVESNLINAAELLLKETRTDITLNQLTNTLFNSSSVDINNMMCNYESGNILHKEALKGKFALRVDIKKEERRIDLLYKNADNPWCDISLIELDSYWGQRKYEIVHIPKTLDDTIIAGLDEEMGVKTRDGVFLTPKHRLTKFIVEKMESFRYMESEVDNMLLRIFVTYILNDKLLSATKDITTVDDVEQHFFNLIERVNSRRHMVELKEELWKKIDRKEFFDLTLMKKDVLFDTADWSRNNRYIFDY